MYGSTIDHVHINDHGSTAEVSFAWTSPEGTVLSFQLGVARVTKSTDVQELLEPLKLLVSSLVGDDIEPGELDRKFRRALLSAVS